MPSTRPLADPAPDAARFWDQTARRYAADPIADLPGYERTVRRVRELLRPTDDVLEIGCGTGTTALQLAAGSRRYLATDVSEEMIAIAREKWAAQPVPPLRFEVAAAEHSLRDTGAHDTVLAFNLLHLVPDLDGMVGAVAAALRRGGTFISKTPCLAEMNPLVPHVLVPLMRLFGKAPSVKVFDAGTLQAAIRRHGLLIDAVERHGSKRRDMRVFIVAHKPR